MLHVKINTTSRNIDSKRRIPRETHVFQIKQTRGSALELAIPSEQARDFSDVDSGEGLRAAFSLAEYSAGAGGRRSILIAASRGPRARDLGLELEELSRVYVYVYT